LTSDIFVFRDEPDTNTTQVKSDITWEITVHRVTIDLKVKAVDALCRSWSPQRRTGGSGRGAKDAGPGNDGD
jgi:hypothetical protein